MAIERTIILKIDLRTRKGFKISKRYEVTILEDVSIDELISALDDLIRENFETK